MHNIECKRCGQNFKRIDYLLNHLKKTISCKPELYDISRDELINNIKKPKLLTGYQCDYCDKFFNSSQGKYQHKKICKENQYNKNEINELKKEIDQLKNLSIINTTNNNQKLKLELQYYKNRKNENFYQLLLEDYLGGTHKTLSCGITDITTDTCHAETKEWSSWKEAVGQLFCYNASDPKESIEMYMFGKYTQKCKDEAVKIATSYKINIYEFVETDDDISIISLKNNETVYKYKPE